MDTISVDSTWERLVRSDVGPMNAFDPGSLDGLPGPAQRLLKRVLPEDTPLVSCVELATEGQIKLGPRWMRFTADQILRAGIGFVWKPVVGGRVLRFTGADLLSPDDARMEFRLLGIIPLVRAGGADIARSAAGRLAAETVLWLPQALTPQAGASWVGRDDSRAVVTLPSQLELPEVEVTVGSDGRLVSTLTQRWNGSSKPPRLEPFGGPVHDEYRTAADVLVAGTGSGGWGWTTPTWSKGEFFRFTLKAAQPITTSPKPATGP